MENNTPKKIMNEEKKLYGEQVLDGLKHVESENDSYSLLINFADATVYVASMHITRTFDGYLEGRPDVICADVGAIYLGNVYTQFSLTDSNNYANAFIRSTGIFLKESGGIGTVNQLDLTS